MKKFKLFWVDGTSSIVEGKSLSDAVSNAGYDQDKLSDLEHFEPVEE